MGFDVAEKPERTRFQSMTVQAVAGARTPRRGSPLLAPAAYRNRGKSTCPSASSVEEIAEGRQPEPAQFIGIGAPIVPYRKASGD